MTTSISERIRGRLHELGMTPQAASLKAGLSKDTLRKLLANDAQVPAGRTLTGLALALEVDEQWILTGTYAERGIDAVVNTPDGPKAVQYKSYGGNTRPAQASIPARVEMPNDVPVRGTAAGSHLKGAFQFTSDAIDYVRRPPALTGARDIYALYVEGSSMEPQYFPGDLVYVHPHKPPRVGDAIVVQCAVDETQVEATLGIYHKRSEHHITILKRNPESFVQIKRDTVKAVHKVLTTNELFGV